MDKQLLTLQNQLLTLENYCHLHTPLTVNNQVQSLMKPVLDSSQHRLLKMAVKRNHEDTIAKILDGDSNGEIYKNLLSLNEHLTQAYLQRVNLSEDPPVAFPAKNPLKEALQKKFQEEVELK